MNEPLSWLAEQHTKAKSLRDSPMVKAWIAAYQANLTTPDADCGRCGYPHSRFLMCGPGAVFGRLQLGRDWYSIDFSNVGYFHDFMLKLGDGWGFHWRNNTYFKRAGDGTVEVRYFEQYNNCPQEKVWRIPPNEWASIVCSVSKDGETGERWDAAQDFHGR